MARAAFAVATTTLALTCLACNGASRPQPAANERLAPEPPPDPDALGREIEIEDPSGEALVSFHRALRRAQNDEGQARIIVYGGSHMASDLFTGRMRDIFQRRFGDAGHGFVPLVPMIHNAWRWGVRIDEAEGFGVQQIGFKHRDIERYGLFGAFFTADEEGAFAAIESASWGVSRNASHIELLYDRRPGGGHFDVLLDGREMARVSAAADPASEARVTYDISDGPHRIEARTLGDGPVTVFGAIFERPGAGVLVENLGLVGGKARHQLLWDEGLWRRTFVERRADLVLYAYGNNETTDTHLTIAQHAEHFRQLLVRVRAAAPEASCVLVGPTDRARLTDEGAYEPFAVVEPLTEMQRALAEEQGCAFFDTLAFQGGLGVAAEWLRHDPPYMRDDRQHLSRYGYRRWAEVVTRALLAGAELDP